MKKVLMFLACIFSMVHAGALDVPKLVGRVNDYANVLTPEERQTIEEMLRQTEEETSNQIVFLSVSSLQGDDLAGFAQRVYTTWKLGTKKNNNGALFVLSSGDKMRRIHTGYGLEGALPDAICKNILAGAREKFRNKEYYAGTQDVLAKMIQATKGEYVVENGATRNTGTADSKTFAMWVIGVVGIIVTWGLCLASRIVGGISGLLFGAIIGIILGTIPMIILLPIVGFIIGLFLRDITPSDFGGSGGTYDYSSSSGSDGGSSLSDSIFSGGGGDSGGGGANDGD